MNKKTIKDELITERLILRKLRKEDTESVFFNWANDPEVAKYVTWHPHKSIEETKQIMDIWLNEYQDPKTIRYGITLKDCGELIGSIDVVGYVNNNPEIGYCLSRKYWNQGYMTEACKAVVDYLFSIGYKTVVIEANEDNAPSNRVIEKCGFEFTNKETKPCSQFKPDIITVNWYEIKKDSIKNYTAISEDDVLSIVKMDTSMYYDVYRNSLDEDNRKYVPDEVFETIEEAKEVIDFIIKSYDSDEGPFIYAIIRKKDNRNIGYVQLIKIDEGWEIGYHIAKIYTGNGYATEALRLFLKHLSKNTQLDQVYGVALSINKASKRVLEKCGFERVFEGIDLYQGKKRKIIKTIKKLR